MKSDVAIVQGFATLSSFGARTVASWPVSLAGTSYVKVAPEVCSAGVTNLPSHPVCCCRNTDPKHWHC